MAAIEGCYVPSLYEVSYYENGIFRSISPIISNVQFPIQKRVICDMDSVHIDDKPIYRILRLFMTVRCLKCFAVAAEDADFARRG